MAESIRGIVHGVKKILNVLYMESSVARRRDLERFVNSHQSWVSNMI